LLRHEGERNGRDIELTLANEVQQQVEGTVEDIDADAQRPGARLAVATGGR
jgi:hypothetical protein